MYIYTDDSWTAHLIRNYFWETGNKLNALKLCDSAFFVVLYTVHVQYIITKLIIFNIERMSCLLSMVLVSVYAQ